VKTSGSAGSCRDRIPKTGLTSDKSVFAAHGGQGTALLDRRKAFLSYWGNQNDGVGRPATCGEPLVADVAGLLVQAKAACGLAQEFGSLLVLLRGGGVYCGCRRHVPGAVRMGKTSQHPEHVQIWIDRMQARSPTAHDGLFVHSQRFTAPASGGSAGRGRHALLQVVAGSGDPRHDGSLPTTATRPRRPGAGCRLPSWWVLAWRARPARRWPLGRAWCRAGRAS
jgi:hypothetical protein